MELEEKVKQLVFEGRRIKYSDNNYSESHGTYGKVSSQMQEWYDRCEQLILKEANIESEVFEKFESIDLEIINGNYKGKFDTVKNHVLSCLRQMLIDSRKSVSPKKIESSKNISSKDIFIVHGHDDGLKNKVARFLENIGYNPIILHEQASKGKTIIEKIEAYSNVNFGIVLYTGCDLGKVAREDVELKKRARQNVVFEHGYLIGKIGRNSVCALVENEVEIPNDVSGVVYVEIDKNDAWKYSIAKEMKGIGLTIDMNRIK